MTNRFNARIATTTALTAMIVSATGVFAADLSPPPEPEMRSSVYDWSGAYVGATASRVVVDAAYVPIGASDPELGGDGLMGGLYAGYNYQRGNLVIGVEGDVNFGEVDPGNTPDTVYQDVGFIATLRGRLGYAHDRTMAYVTGGIAFMDSEITIQPADESRSVWHTGYTIGGGMEHAWTDNFVGRVEYLYADFGTEDYVYAAGTVRYEAKDFHIVRIGGAWKF